MTFVIHKRKQIHGVVVAIVSERMVEVSWEDFGNHYVMLEDLEVEER